MAQRKKKQRWLQEASQRMEEKGTKGAFTRWCKQRGYGGVTRECIEAGKRSSDPTIRKRAIFAENVRKIAKKRKSSRKTTSR